jgi:hypothetical protein
MSDDDLDLVMETGERLPLDLLDDPGLLSSLQALVAPLSDTQSVNRTEE